MNDLFTIKIYRYGVLYNTEYDKDKHYILYILSWYAENYPADTYLRIKKQDKQQEK